MFRAGQANRLILKTETSGRMSNQAAEKGSNVISKLQFRLFRVLLGRNLPMATLHLG